MNIITSGGLEPLDLSKIQSKLEKYAYGLDLKHVNLGQIATKVVANITDNITSIEIDNYTAQVCEQLSVNHPDYLILGGRILADRLQKQAPKKFSESVQALRNFNKKLVDDHYYQIVQKHADYFDSLIQSERDFDVTIFEIESIKKKYLMSTDQGIVETPQYYRMRVAVALWGEDLERVKQTYERLSKKEYTQAGCTSSQAGKEDAQLANCILMAMEDNLVEENGIFDSLKQVANYQKGLAGLGVALTKLRAKGADVRGEVGVGKGVLPVLKLLEQSVGYVFRGKKAGSIAVYLETWHADIIEYLKAKRPNTPIERGAPKLDYGLVVNSLFMQRVNEGGDWSLFCPSQTPDLIEAYGEEFNQKYLKYEKTGLTKRTIKARDLMNEILMVMQEAGQPYMLNKDEVNWKNNLKHVAPIIQSNLCIEITLPTNNGVLSTCNLGNLILPSCVENGQFNFEKLRQLSYEMCENLNQVIDTTYYPEERGRQANLANRPIGIGIQGLADSFAMLDLAYESLEARELNKQISETIYFGAMQASNDLAKQKGAYPNYTGSPASQGELQFDFWQNKEVDFNKETKTWEVSKSSPVKLSGLWDWDNLKQNIKKNGLYNSLLTAYMPTLGSSQVIGNTQSFEPFQPLVTKQKTLAGEFLLVNRHFVRDMIKADLWSPELAKMVLDNDGSIQNIEGIPDQIKLKYKNYWEVSMKQMLVMAAERSPFIDHSSSQNWYVKKPSTKGLDDKQADQVLQKYKVKLLTLVKIAHMLGLKTLVYYLETGFDQKTSVGNLKIQKKNNEQEFSSNGTGKRQFACEGGCE